MTIEPVYPDGSETPTSPYKPWSKRFNQAPVPIGDVSYRVTESPWFKGYEDEWEALMRCAPFQEPHQVSDTALGAAAMREVYKLEPLKRFLVIAHVIEGASIRDLGKALSMPRSTVHSTFQRAIIEIREALEDE